MGARGFVEFVLAYVKTNVQAAMEYRASFLFQAIGMVVNDFAWLVFWAIIFSRFPAINGFTFNTILLLFSFTTMSFGIASFFFGNWQHLAKVIIRGQLDYYLTLPKPSLLHVLISRSDFSGIGDFVFGLVLALLALTPTLLNVALFLALIVTSTIILVSIGSIFGSLTFFIGGTGDFQDFMIGSVISFTMYPFSIFDSYARVLMLTVIPVGFIAGVPVMLLQSFNAALLLYVVVAAAASVVAAILVFKAGLRRYESGNL